MNRVAVLGCGRIAQHHCEAIKKNRKLELVAVCDINEETSEITGKKHSVGYYQNFSEMVRNVDFDTVAIITPSGAHFDHAYTILDGFGKNLIIEKPTLLKKSQFSELKGKANKLGKKVFPIFQNRKNLAVSRVARGIKDGELGQIQTVSVRVRWCRDLSYYNLAPWRGTFSMDGGALTNQGVHHLDLLRYLCGEPVRVSGHARTFGADIEVEDTFLGICEFENNKCLGSLEVTTAARPKDFCAEISILGSRGLAQIGGIAVNELQIYTPEPSSCRSHTEDFSDCVYGNGHQRLYSEIASDLNNSNVNSNYSISLDDAFKTISFLDACYRSIEENSMVDVQCDSESKNLGSYNQRLYDIYKLT